jgi:hypothetical protein
MEIRKILSKNEKILIRIEGEIFVCDIFLTVSFGCYIYSQTDFGFSGYKVALSLIPNSTYSNLKIVNFKYI